MKRGLFVTAFLLIVCLGVVLSWSVSASSTTLSQVNALQEAFCDSVSEIPGQRRARRWWRLYESTDGGELDRSIPAGLATYTPCSWAWHLYGDGDHVYVTLVGCRNQLGLGEHPPGNWV